MSKMDAIKVSVENDSDEKSDQKLEKKIVKRKRVMKKNPTKIEAKKTETTGKTKTKSSKRGFFSHLLVFTMTAAVVGGGIYYWQSGEGKAGIEKLQSDARNTRINLEDRLSSIKDKLQGVESENEELKVTKKDLEEKATLLDGALKKYSNSDLKLTFNYPVLFGEVNVKIEETESGKKFSGSFSKNEDLLFGGVAEDYLVASSSMSDQFLDTQGFEKIGERYFYKSIHGDEADYRVEAMRVVETRNGEALMINKDSFALSGGEEAWDFGLGQNIGAIVNLDNEDFSGIAFVNKNTAKFPLADFEEMLKSMEIK